MCMFVCLPLCLCLLPFYSLNATFTECEENLFSNLADLVKWVDTPVQYRGKSKLTTDDVKYRVKDFEKSLDVSKSFKFATIKTFVHKVRIIHTYVCYLRLILIYL